MDAAAPNTKEAQIARAVRAAERCGLKVYEMTIEPRCIRLVTRPLLNPRGGPIVPPTNGCACMVRIILKGIHRMTKTLASGERREYHYAFRGGPLIWKTRDSYAIGSAEYVASYRDASEGSKAKVSTYGPPRLQEG